MELLNSIRSNYGINPVNHKQITKNVYLIEDAQNLYSFKISTMNQNELTMWKHVLHEAHEKKLFDISPIYITKSSEFFILFNDNIAYLSPWINHQQTDIELIYQCIGQLHRKTKSNQHIKVEQVKKQFSNFKRICLSIQKNLLTYVEEFERQRYMSPIELQVCSHYRDIELVLRKIDEQIDKLIDDDDREIIHWSYSLSHGQLNFSHILQGDRTYLINWEKASYKNATVDLINLFKNEVISYDSPEEEFINFFSNYMNHNELTYEELIILSIHLLDPMQYIHLVEQYVNDMGTDSFIVLVQKLQCLHRQLLFALKLTRLIETDYEMPLLNYEEN